MTDLAAQAAWSVPCPQRGCGAQPGQPCRSRKPFHNARASAGLNRAIRDEHTAHERIWRALGRVRQAAAAGRTPAAADITTALGSCGCGECRAAVRALAAELAPWLRDGEVVR